MRLCKWTLPFLTLLAAAFSTGATCDTQTLTITPALLPEGTVNADYSVSLKADNNADGIWAVASGDLPSGISLNASTGVLSGKPTESGQFQFTLSVNRIFVGSGERAYTLKVNPKLQVDFNLSIARQDEPYSETIDATGGVPPYVFEVIGLPAGLSVDPDTGEISGTPVEPENGRTIQATVTDSVGQSVTEQDTLLIKPRAVQILTAEADPGRVNLPYVFEIEASDGLPPYHFAVTDGALPPGLSLPDDLSSGVISGIPSEAGNFTFTITVTDADDPQSSDSMEYTIAIAPA